MKEYISIPSTMCPTTTITHNPNVDVRISVQACDKDPACKGIYTPTCNFTADMRALCTSTKVDDEEDESCFWRKSKSKFLILMSLAFFCNHQ